MAHVLNAYSPGTRVLCEALLDHDGSPTHAAEQLFCHRNTVIYRMKHLEGLTGRSLQDPRDKLLLSLGLMGHAHGVRPAPSC